jgi:hypothetical protein
MSVLNSSWLPPPETADSSVAATPDGAGRAMPDDVTWYRRGRTLSGPKGSRVSICAIEPTCTSPLRMVTMVCGEKPAKLSRRISRRRHSSRLFDAVQPSRMSSSPSMPNAPASFSAAISGI